MKVQRVIAAGAVVATACHASVIQTRQQQHPLVDSDSLQSFIKKDSLLEKANKLQAIADRNGGNRAWGTKGHMETIEWIYETIKATDYYNVEFQPFNITQLIFDKMNATFSDGTKPEWVQGVKDGKQGYFEGDLALVKGCKKETFSNPALKGKIILLITGKDDVDCGWDGVETLYNTGVAGLIASSAPAGSPKPDPIIFPGNVSALFPIVFMDGPTGVKLEASLAKSPMKASLDIEYRNVNTTTYNIIAETKGGDHSKVITSGAHSDSVPEGPGINDDGSGLITQMEIAVALSKYSVKNAVRWFWWSAEEIGLVGSNHYTQTLSKEEQDKIVLHMDFDMLASNNYIYAVYDGAGTKFPEHKGPEGSAHLQETFSKFFAKHNITTRPYDLDGRSDYVGFQKLGIAVGGVKTGAEKHKTANETALYGGETDQPYDKCYHSKCDRVDNLAMDAWVMNSRCIADAIAVYANSIDGIEFPRKGNATN